MADRDHEEQQGKASGLHLTIAAIGLWNTVSLEKAIPAMVEAGNPMPEYVIPHLPPLGWEHITLAGSYWWRKFRSDMNVLRPLRTLNLATQVQEVSVGKCPPRRGLGQRTMCHGPPRP